MNAPVNTLLDTITVTISVDGIDLLALKKLSLVSHALAQKFSFGAAREQKLLAETLDNLIRQIELKAAEARS
jgi:hypothetical protein